MLPQAKVAWKNTTACRYVEGKLLTEAQPGNIYLQAN